MSEYPDEFYRGISSIDYITPEGYVSAAAFQFDPYDSSRDDEYCELSVNWNDNEESLQVLLNQHKPMTEDKQFKGGYCTINRIALNNHFKLYMDSKAFTYERRPVEATEENDYQENLYHGNLLMKNTLDKQVKKNIHHALALMAGIATKR